MFRIADPTEVEKLKSATAVSKPKKGGFGRIILWIIIIIGIAFILYQFYG